MRERFFELGGRAELRCPSPGLRPPVVYAWEKEGRGQGGVARDTKRRGVRERGKSRISNGISILLKKAKNITW